MSENIVKKSQFNHISFSSYRASSYIAECIEKGFHNQYDEIYSKNIFNYLIIVDGDSSHMHVDASGVDMTRHHCKENNQLYVYK